MSALLLLTSRPGTVFPAGEIWRAMSGEHEKPEEAQKKRVKIVIAELRTALGYDGSNSPYVEFTKGPPSGYVFTEPVEFPCRPVAAERGGETFQGLPKLDEPEPGNFRNQSRLPLEEAQRRVRVDLRKLVATGIPIAALVIAVVLFLSSREPKPDVAGPSWTALSFLGELPAPRDGSNRASGYDDTNNRLLFFGGFTTGTALLNDTWVLVGADGTYPPQWISQLTQNPPAPHRNHAGAYDKTNNRLIIFGGCLGQCLPIDDNVYVLENANGLGGSPVWRQLITTGAQPPRRNGHTAVYAPASNRLIVFGGDDCCGRRYQDTWVLTNANGTGGAPTWMELSTRNPPPPRAHHSAVYDTKYNRMIIAFGNGDVDLRPLDDVWVLTNADGTGSQPEWIQLPVDGPSPRWGHQASLDAGQNQMIVFGGRSRAGSMNDVWVLLHADGLGGIPAWRRIITSGDSPRMRHGSIGAYNAISNRLIVFGGDGPLNDTWVLPEAAPKPDQDPPVSVSDFNLLILERNGVKEYNGSTGEFLRDFIAINFPVSVLPDNAGRLYLAHNPSNAGPAGIRRYSDESGSFLDEFIPPGSGGLVLAGAMAFGPDGQLYVVSGGTHNIKKYDAATGRYLGDFIPSGSGGLVGPTGMVFGPDKNLYVSSVNTHSVKRYSGATGAFLGDFIKPGQGGLAYPEHLRFGGQDRLCVAGATIDRKEKGQVFCYDSRTGAFINAFTAPNMSTAFEILFGPDGHLYVNHTGGGSEAVYRFNPFTGSFIDSFLKEGLPVVDPKGMLFIRLPEPER